MGPEDRSCRQLASTDLVIAHDGLPIFWPETLGTSSDERSPACMQCAPALFALGRNDPGLLAQSLCGGPFRSASPACRIRGVGGRAQGRAQRSFALLSMLAYARWTRESTLGNARAALFYGLALLCFVLGLMSKSMLVTIPFVLLLLDYWPLGRFLLGPPLSWTADPMAGGRGKDSVFCRRGRREPGDPFGTTPGGSHSRFVRAGRDAAS